MDDQTELINGIKQLVVGFAPHVRDARSLEELHNAYLRMEEFDKNFHRYTFVKNLRSAIEDAVGQSIDTEINRHSIDHSAPSAEQEAIVRNITSKVLKSPEYRSLSKHVQDAVGQTCDYILSSGRKDFFQGDAATGGATGREHGNEDHQAKSEILFSDAESSIGDNSLNHSTVIFMNSSQQRGVAEGLRRSNGIEMRRHAIRDLLQVTGFDVQTCSVWPQIRDGLRDALFDTDEELWTQTLRFLARGLSTNSACSREIYVTLVGFIKDQLRQPGGYKLPYVGEGLSVTSPNIRKILTEFRLVNSFQQMVPHYWQRYPEGCLEEILEPTLALVDADVYSPMIGRLTPMHFLALVDCKACWFIKSMHGQFSRNHLLKILEKHNSIVDNAVKACLYYASNVIKMGDELNGGDITLRSAENGRIVYDGPQIEFAYFTHSLCILGRLILYEQGRKFFPVKFLDDEEPVTVTRLLVTLLRMVIHISRRRQPTVTTQSASDAFDPCILIVDMVTKLCSAEDVCCRTMCKDKIAHVLMAPIKEYLSGGGRSYSSGSATLIALSRVAEILSAIAMTHCGQQLLLYGESYNWRSSTDETLSAPVHILAKFAQLALPALDDEAFRLHVVGSLVFVCRQLYSTCEGLLILNQHRLHHSITSTWKTASREASTLTPTPASTGRDRDRPSVVQWEELLRDDLLNFAGTPKGVLLLQQTGAMHECVEYMHSRYARKLQVSKCEKFGYGYMMSQVAGTAPGIVALHETKFTVSLIKALWDVVEMLDNGPWKPKCWPVGPIDKQAKKPFMRIVNLLSSFHPVYEIIVGQRPSTTKPDIDHRQAPTTIVDLLDRLVFIDSPAKIQAFFNYEDSHFFGLRLLSALTSCLDTFLLLQDKYSFQEMLMVSQAENVVEDQPNNIILDMLSLERNYILVKTFFVGGYSERNLPPRQLTDDDGKPFTLPLFSSYPIPSVYIPSIAVKQTKEDSGFSRFVSKTKKSDLQRSWLEAAQNVLCSELNANPGNVDLGALFQLLEYTVEVMSQNPEDAVFSRAGFSVPDGSFKKVNLSSMQMHGVTLSVRYGRHLQLLPAGKDLEDRLYLVLKRIGAFLRQQKLDAADCTSSSLECVNSNSEVGFDWFLATVFLMTSGNVDRSGKFLAKFASLFPSVYLWTHRVHCSALLPRSFVLSGILPIYSGTCHNIELILQLSLPQVYSAFKMSGCSPAQVCQPWLNQCFWNYLDWPQVCQYVAICIVLGIDYQVYFCVAILRHLQRQLLQQMQDKNLLAYLKEEPIRDFVVGDEHLNYMRKLQDKFRHIVLADMRGVLTEP